MSNLAVALISIFAWIVVCWLLTKSLAKLRTSEGRNSFKSWIETNKHAIAAVLLATLTMPMVAYVSKFGVNGLSGDPAEWGLVGDFFGGLLNPILAFVSFMALLYTINLQSRQLDISKLELEATRKELVASRKAQEDSSIALDGQLLNLKLQRLDNFFFKLIQHHSFDVGELNLDSSQLLAKNVSDFANSPTAENIEIIFNSMIYSGLIHRNFLEVFFHTCAVIYTWAGDDSDQVTNYFKMLALELKPPHFFLLAIYFSNCRMSNIGNQGNKERYEELFYVLQREKIFHSAPVLAVCYNDIDVKTLRFSTRFAEISIDISQLGLSKELFGYE